jgi:hypothetical protein
MPATWPATGAANGHAGCDLRAKWSLDGSISPCPCAGCGAPEKIPMPQRLLRTLYSCHFNAVEQYQGRLWL